MFGRRYKTRQELMAAEFGDSMDHFRQAAVHAAGGIGATVGPMSGNAKTRMTSARGMVRPTAGKLSNSATSRVTSSWDSTIAAFAPIVQAAREGATRANAIEARKIKQASKMIEAEDAEDHAARSVMTLIACGAAVGAAGALIARRRNRAKWAEYEPSSLESDASSLIEPSTTATTSVSSKGSGALKKAGDVTKSAMGTVRGKIHEATAERDRLDLDSTATPAERMQGMTDDARGAMKHANDKANEGTGHFRDTGGRGAEGSAESAEDVMRSSKNGRR